MLTSIAQVNEEFFKKFTNISVKRGEKSYIVPCEYYKKSSYDYSETDREVYPCISIQDYTPTPKDNHYIDMRRYFGGVSVDNLKGYLYNRPIWLTFRFDVSIASKSYKEYNYLKNYFLGNFVYAERFLFDTKSDGETLIGDVVPYSVRTTDVPRNDGVFETNYEFTCDAWVYIKEPEEVELITTIILKGSPMELKNN